PPLSAELIACAVNDCPAWIVLSEMDVITAFGAAAETSRGEIPPTLTVPPLVVPPEPVPLVLPLTIPPLLPVLPVVLLRFTVNEIVLVAPAVPVARVPEYGVALTLWLPSVIANAYSFPSRSPAIAHGLTVSMRYRLKRSSRG